MVVLDLYEACFEEGCQNECLSICVIRLCFNAFRLDDNNVIDLGSFFFI